MKSNFWSIHISGYDIPVLAPEEPIDSIEACTRAIEWLHQVKIDYSIGPAIAATCDSKTCMVKSDIVLANAGKFIHCEKLRNLIKNYNTKMKNKA